jgi:hypothetical protein
VKTEEQVWTVLVETNPVPDVNQYGHDEDGGAAYLATLEPRSSEVTQLDAKQTESTSPKRSMVPWLIAAGVAAVIGVAVIIASLNTEEAPVVDQPTLTAGPVTIETELDLSDTPNGGTFEITIGADVLGCSSGTFVQMDSETFAKKDSVMTCESGSNTGTFSIVYDPENFNWNVLESSGDFAGLQGEGRFSFVFTSANVIDETFTGDIEYTP